MDLPRLDDELGGLERYDRPVALRNVPDL